MPVRQGVKRLCSRTGLRRTVCWHIAVSEPVVAITFDDGPTEEWTPPVLDLLRKYGAPATFFVQGTCVEQLPALFRRIVDEGHEIGNHGYNHVRRDARNQASRCDRVLRAAGVSTKLFRPPAGDFGFRDLAWLARAGFSTVLWSFDAVDSMRADGNWAGPPPDYSRIVQGDILLLHDDNGICVDELPVLLETLRSKGLRPVLTSELIGTSSHEALQPVAGADR